MSEPHKSFFHTFTGVITAITSLIIALTGLYAATGGFNFNTLAAPPSSNTEKSVVSTSEQDHQKQLEALKRQKQIDDLRITQQKQTLLAEQELAALRAKNAKLNQNITVIPDQSSQYHVTNNLSGRWHYANAAGTYVFVLEQNGSELLLQEFDSYGNNVGNGSGVIQGTQVFLNWVEPYLFIMSLEIEAQLQINSQGNALIGNMFAQGNTVPIALYRQ
ncbi:hypothetical protein [Paraglaciecola sp. MB-3u-78]|uniref:hypothetical protein n=1 Tax=Paraglaciecola sp. MB-3u-78 TaxID=2058332 RepID=UPI000C329174|nr:hypothetical protein [Paraglaciecola sp. MB-3u-78]PKG92902.1 hypothetical protein CXF95_28395 [Paraglaciecola sp. MB-3u-78]